MKKYLFFLIVLVTYPVCASSQALNCKFEPLSYEELILVARAEAARDAYNKRKFQEYQEEAYERYNKQDWYGFITYSNYALSTGWYNAQLYYYRGVVFEKLNEFKKAKKEYKKAKKKGYAYAEVALVALKSRQKKNK